MTEQDSPARLLAALRGSEPWRYAVVPAVRARIASLQRRLATDPKLRQDTHLLTELQVEHRLLTRLLDPEDFFREAEEKPDGSRQHDG